MMTIDPDELAAEIVLAINDRTFIQGVYSLDLLMETTAEIIRHAMYGKMGPAKTFHEAQELKYDN